MPLFSGRPEIGVVYSDYERMDDEGRPLPKGPRACIGAGLAVPLLIENFVSFPSASCGESVWSARYIR